MASEIACTLDRRRFLLMSSAGALGVSALAESTYGLSSTSVDRELVLGWCSDTTASLVPEELPARLLPAQRLASGDQQLSTHGVHVVVHGLCGDAERLAEDGVRHAALHVTFPTGHSFTPWSFSAGPFCRVAGACEFDVPVEAPGLQISLEVGPVHGLFGRLSGAAVHRSSLLRVDSEPSAAKLRTGTYGIPLRQQDGPSWSPSVLQLGDDPWLILSVHPAAL
ncbi:MAG: hypothetical protein MPN21_12195 [Thermoanaerobaculia bacterium]|nr:hypothetical protein [Thermoanaerobaculia bacterium]